MYTNIMDQRGFQACSRRSKDSLMNMANNLHLKFQYDRSCCISDGINLLAVVFRKRRKCNISHMDWISGSQKGTPTNVVEWPRGFKLEHIIASPLRMMLSVVANKWIVYWKVIALLGGQDD